ncbi:THO complex subunit 5B, variant 2 [Ancistrocladus abbreviatus]
MEERMEDGGGAAEEEAAAPLAPPKQQKNMEKSPFDMLKESKTSVEEIVAKLLSTKKEKKLKSELRELVTQMFLNFVSLRQANRSILIEEDRARAETECSKVPVELTTLHLHNLMYEKNHHAKAIHACKDFKSKYPDIELVSEEEFFGNAPEEIKGSVISNDSSHNLMLRRLNYELFQRKELCKLRERLEEQKKSLLETIANQKKFLSSLPSQLKSLKKASLPVQQRLGVLHIKKQKQQYLAELLPPPLYIIYSLFISQKEAFGEKIDLEIIGRIKDAQASAHQQSNRDSGILDGHHSESIQRELKIDAMGCCMLGVSTNQESFRMEDDVLDGEDDDKRRRKRPKKIPGNEGVDQAEIYQAHPLKFVLHIFDDELGESKLVKLATLKFEYLLKLNVVCVGIEESGERPQHNILCNLFPDDTGLELPHQSAKLLLGEGMVFEEQRPLRPYKWAQHLAGIDILPEASPLLVGSETQNDEGARTALISGLSLYRQQNCIQMVVERVRTRVKTQLALALRLA